MRILHSMDEFDGPGCVVALGTFDGVHLGHARLIKRAVGLARKWRLPAAALTFDRHPLALIRPDAVPAPLTSRAEKARLLAELGVDILVEETFTEAFAAQTPEEYLARVCRALRPCAVVAGYNHTFGRYGRGNAALLEALGRKLGYEPVIVEAVCVDNEPVSSSRIRALLTAGRLAEAERLAGHPLCQNENILSPEQKFSTKTDLQASQGML